MVDPSSQLTAIWFCSWSWLNSRDACSMSHPQLPCPGTHVTMLMGLPHMNWDYKGAGVLRMAVSAVPGVVGNGSIMVTQNGVAPSVRSLT